ncbi:MAG: L-aspartate oxidase [Clostridiales bacterium]|nr:L-aspartate oxidase [Clostridiales bacterium]
MNKIYDTIIVGTGIAGLYTALNIDPKLNVLLISKRELALCNSALAQGGIAAVMDRDNDSTDLHLSDTLIAGGYSNDPNTAKTLVEEGPIDISNLISYGVEFDKNADGTLHLTLEGGHSRHRVVHYKDATGNEVVSKLILAVKERRNIDMIEHAFLCDLKQVTGGFTVDILHNDEYIRCSSPYVVLATGGIGRVYEYTTNSAIATGDGIAFAYSIGAKVQNMSYIQFHPTAFANKNTRESFLISEAVRGEGAYLLNCNYERFMGDYDERMELAPRDVVSRSIMLEALRTGSDNFYLDISHKDPVFLKKRFPMIYGSLMKEGYDLTKDRIPIYPCQHYIMGGIKVDGRGRTSVDGLYAAGECSHTGVHGDNRLASNSLLEALVFSRQLALDINKRAQGGLPKVQSSAVIENHGGEDIMVGIRTRIRNIMQRSYFVIPNSDEAKTGFEEICRIKDMLYEGNYAITPDYIEARSLVTIAYLVLKEVI